MDDNLTADDTIFLNTYYGQTLVNGEWTGNENDEFYYDGAVVLMRVDMEAGTVTWMTKNGTVVDSQVFESLKNGQDWYFTCVLSTGVVNIELSSTSETDGSKLYIIAWPILAAFLILGCISYFLLKTRAVRAVHNWLTYGNGISFLSLIAVIVTTDSGDRQATCFAQSWYDKAMLGIMIPFQLYMLCQTILKTQLIYSNP